MKKLLCDLAKIIILLQRQSRKIKYRKFWKIAVPIAVIFAILASYFTFFYKTKEASAAWWNDSWQYRKPIAITNSSGSDLADFQVQALAAVDLSADVAAGKIRSDLGDLRFTEANGELLSYWIEDTASTSADVWVKMASVPKSGATIYMYYGNQSALSQSDGRSVFEFFDDFNNPSWTSANWTQGNGTWTLSGGVYTGTVSSAEGYSMANYTALSNYIAEAKIKTAAAHAGLVVRAAPGGLNYEGEIHVPTTISIFRFSGLNTYTGLGDVSGATFAINTFYNAKFSVNGSSLKWEVVDGTGTTRTNSVTDATYATGRPGVWTYNDTSTFDDFRVRKYASAEPVAAAPSAEEKGTGPVGYWSFDEGYGTTANDETANKNNGTLTGMSATASSTSGWQAEDNCVSGKCLAFDGEGDYVSRADTGSLHFKDGLITISYWMKTKPGWVATQTTAHGTVVNKFVNDPTGGTGQQGFLLGTPFNYGGTIDAYYFDIGNGTGQDVLRGGDESLVADNKWHYIVGVSDATTLYIYIDGILKNTKARTYTGDISVSRALNIGQQEQYGREYFGLLDEVKIYNYARSAAQIRLDYNAGLAGVGGRAAAEGVNVAAGERSAQWLSSGLVGWWKMDEALWNGTANEVVDYSGLGNHGTAAGSASTTAGRLGKGGVFDGDSDYVSIPNTNFKFTGSFSVSGWIKRNGEARSPLITLGDGNDYQNRFRLRLRAVGNAYPSFSMGEGGVDSIFAVGSNATVSNRWYYLTGVYNNENKKLYLYVDGVLAGESTTVFDGQWYDPGAETLKIGFDSTYLNGFADDVRIYNRALSDREIRDLYNYAPGPMGWWKLDEGSGTTVNDSSGRRNNGTTNGSWVPGKFGKGVESNGSKTISLGSSTDLNSSQFTLEMWLKVNAYNPTVYTAAWDNIIMGRETYSASGFRYGVANTGIVKFWADQSGGSLALTSSIAIKTGAFYHLAITYDSANSTGKMYINGVQAATATGSFVVPTGLVLTVLGGVGGTQSVKGAADDIRFYNYARTAEQVMEDMNARGATAEGGGGTAAVSASGKTALGYWKFDEGQGTTAYDSSPQKNNGALYAYTATSSMWSKNGKFGGAMSFDGTNDRVSVTPVFVQNSDYTVSAWIKRNELGVTHGIFSDYQYAWWGFYVASTNKLVMNHYSGSAANLLSGNINIGTEWTHVSATFSQSSGMKLYINGKLDTSNSDGTACGLPAGRGPQFIGQYRNDAPGDTYVMDGLIDEVKLYNFAMTAEDIKAEYNQGASLKLGSFSTNSSGVASSSAASIYCVPGSSDVCSPPVGEWKFEEGSGVTANDTSGNGNNGTLTGGPAWTSGKSGKALKFDGSDDYVVGASNLGISGNAALTMCAWIKWTGSSWSSGYPSFMGNNSTGTTNQGLSFTVQSGRPAIDFWVNRWRATDALKVNTWYYVCGTKSPGVISATSKIYVNGVLVAGAVEGTDTTPNIADAAPVVGRLDATRWFQGIVDDVKIYNYARTASQIAWDYNRGAPVGYWKMDECQGGTVHDSSGFGNDGLIYPGGGGTQTATGTCAVAGTMWGAGASGKRNASLSFDGTDDYVNVNSIASSLSNSFSFSAWLYTTGGSGADVKNAVTSQVASYSNYWATMGTYRDKWNFALYDGTNNPISYSVNNFKLNTWTHVVGVRDVVADKLYIYINGVLQGTGTVDTTTSVPAYAAFIIGAQTTQSNRYFPGQVDDVQVFNYALTPQQIKTLYTGGAARF